MAHIHRIEQPKADHDQFVVMVGDDRVSMICNSALLLDPPRLLELLEGITRKRVTTPRMARTDEMCAMAAWREYINRLIDLGTATMAAEGRLAEGDPRVPAFRDATAKSVARMAAKHAIECRFTKRNERATLRDWLERFSHQAQRPRFDEGIA